MWKIIVISLEKLQKKSKKNQQTSKKFTKVNIGKSLGKWEILRNHCTKFQPSTTDTILIKIKVLNFFIYKVFRVQQKKFKSLRLFWSVYFLYTCHAKRV